MAEKGKGIGLGLIGKNAGAKAQGKRHMRKCTETRIQEQWHRGNGTWTRALAKDIEVREQGRETRKWKQGH